MRTTLTVLLPLILLVAFFGLTQTAFSQGQQLNWFPGQPPLGVPGLPPNPNEAGGLLLQDCATSITLCILTVGTIILRILLALVLIAAVIFFIIGGVTYIFGGPDPAKRARARDYLIYSLIGVIAAFLAFTAVGALRIWLETLTTRAR